MASQPIWPAAGHRGEGGPDLVRRDTRPRRDRCDLLHILKAGPAGRPLRRLLGSAGIPQRTDGRSRRFHHDRGWCRREAERSVGSAAQASAIASAIRSGMSSLTRCYRTSTRCYRTSPLISRRSSSTLPRRPSGLPTMQVVALDGPHPPAELVTVAATLERGWSSPAVPSTCPSHRSLTDNSGRSGKGAELDHRRSITSE